MTPFLLPILCYNRCLPSGHCFRFSNRPHKLLTATTLNHFLTIIGLLAAVAGMICLFSGSFSENQFKDAVKLKVVVFTILPLLVLVFLWKATKCIEVIEKGKHSQGSRFNLYSAGSFSAFALVISSKGEKAMELGIFDFLLGLTMDASMEIPGNDGLNLLYVLGAFVYCASLIFIRSCLESFMLSRDISGARQGNIQGLSMVLVEGAREDVAEETANFVPIDPAAEDCGETNELSHITMPVLTSLKPKLMRSNTEPKLMGSNSLNISYLPDLDRNGRDGTSLLTEDWQKNRVRTDVSEFETESLSHGLRRRRTSTILERQTYPGRVAKRSWNARV